MVRKESNNNSKGQACKGCKDIDQCDWTQTVVKTANTIFLSVPPLNKDCKIADILRDIMPMDDTNFFTTEYIKATLKATEYDIALFDTTKWKSEMEYQLAILQIMKYKFFLAFKKAHAEFLKGDFNINDMRDHCRQATSDYKYLSDAELDECLKFVNLPLGEESTEKNLKAFIKDIPIRWNFDDMEKLNNHPNYPYSPKT